jgi:hypothetical protein
MTLDEFRQLIAARQSACGTHARARPACGCPLVDGLWSIESLCTGQRIQMYLMRDIDHDCHMGYRYLFPLKGKNDQI